MSRTIAEYDRSFLLSLLRTMLRIRRLEEKAGQVYGLQKIGGFCHLYIGQEAVATGAIAALDLGTDYVLTAYRDHGHALACGMEMGPIMAELYGKATGCSKGRGGSMHLFDARRHFLGGNGIVGAHLPLATGVALSLRNLEIPGVVLCFFGDGAIHQGAVHESLNLARIWNLPVVFICENNQYGMGTDFRRVSSVTDFSAMAAAWGMPGEQADGMDVLEVFDAVSNAVSRARKEAMPSLLEIQTYRYVGHSMSDPAKYRTREEVQAYREQDPIRILRSRMEDAGILTPDEFDRLDSECRAEAEAAAEFAETSPEPPLEDRFDFVLA